jgi:TIR domain
MARSADFFVSYTSADTAWAEWIAQTLEDAGYQTIVQAWDLSPQPGLPPPDAAGHPARRPHDRGAVTGLPRLGVRRGRVAGRIRQGPDRRARSSAAEATRLGEAVRELAIRLLLVEGKGRWD